MTMKLYGSGATRWVKPYWTLSEIGVPFDAIKLNMREGEHKRPEYLGINPFGKVPALVDGDVKLFESAAICTYLADKYPEAKLIPKAGTAERAYHDQWVSFIISDLEQPLWRIAKHKFVYPEAQRSAADSDLARGDFRQMAGVLEKQIGDQLVARHFSVADIMMAYTLKWAMMVGLLDGFPNLNAYVQRQTARPAFPKQFYG